MRVAAVQFKARRPIPGADPRGIGGPPTLRPTPDDVARSRHALVALAGQATRDADLVVLPEMAASGYVFADREAVARVAEAPDGPTFQALAPLARSARCWVVCGFPELAGDALFNSALVIDPEGHLAFTYRKTLLYDADLPWATPGDSGYRRFETGAGAFGVGICMDLNDDGFVAWCEGQDLDAVAFPTNWVASEVPVWAYWAHRLRGTAAALVAANTWGEEGGVAFTGRSAVLGRSKLLAAAPARGDGVVRATLPRVTGPEESP